MVRKIISIWKKLEFVKKTNNSPKYEILSSLSRDGVFPYGATRWRPPSFESLAHVWLCEKEMTLPTAP